MNRRPIVFSGFFLYINDKKINIDLFKEVLRSGNYTSTEVNRVEIYNIDYEGSYLKINFGDGTLGPRNPKVFNFSLQEEEPNPRLKEQVEPKETFAVLDFNTSFMWISNSKKKNALIALLKSKFPSTVIVAKDIYSEDEFIYALKKLDSIKISAVPNLFSQTGVLSQQLSEEINGYEASVATLSLTYHNTLTTNFLISRIKSIFSERQSLKSIVISGRDENNLGMLFNSEGFSRKIEIECEVDENEMFIQADVFRRITNKIASENS